MLPTSEDETHEIQLDSERDIQSACNNASVDQVSRDQSDLESGSSSAIEAAGSQSDQSSGTEIQAQYKMNKKYMMTPCNHSYHSVCLKKWMDIRLECPTCRQAIPVLDED